MASIAGPGPSSTAAGRVEEIKVFISHRGSACGECREDLGHGAWVMLAGEKGALCMACADLDHLLFLPTGDAAVTRRAKKYSVLSAVVLKWSRARKRYERQGLLVEVEALERAEHECLADAEVRERRRQRQEEQRAEVDRQYVQRFAQRVRELFPSCPPGKDEAVAAHACLKYSGRVGRSAAARGLDAEAVRLAVIAHIRHVETPYDSLLGMGLDRWEARARVQDAVQSVLARWERPR